MWWETGPDTGDWDDGRWLGRASGPGSREALNSRGNVSHNSLSALCHMTIFGQNDKGTNHTPDTSLHLLQFSHITSINGRWTGHLLATTQIWATSECTPIVSKYLGCEESSKTVLEASFSLVLTKSNLLLFCHLQNQSPHTQFCLYSWKSPES